VWGDGFGVIGFCFRGQDLGARVHDQWVRILPDDAWFDALGEIQRCDWLNKPIALNFILGFHLNTMRFSTNHIAVFPSVHQTTKFRQTAV
jgi:hypothetical protein